AGNPASQALDAAGVAATYVTYGDETWNSLKAQASPMAGGDYNANVGPVVTNGSCDRSVNTNWGEPHRSGQGYTAECINYFPIIYSKCALTRALRGSAQVTQAKDRAWAELY